MKKILLVLALSLLTFTLVRGQNIENYFQNKGVYLLAGCAHPTGDYQNGGYDTNQSSDYIVVDFTYKDGNRTVLKVYRSGLFFSKIEVVSDSDFIQPFAALQLVMQLVIDEEKKHPDADVQKVLQYMKTLSNSDPENWSGRTWALFMLNLDYYSS